MAKDKSSLFPQIHAARFGEAKERQREPLFLPRLLDNAGEDVRLKDAAQNEAHRIISKWADLESDGKLQNRKETELEGEFLQQIFCNALGYTALSEGLDHWHISPKFTVPDGQADAAIGFFGVENGDPPVALIELKGPRVNIDRDRPSGRTPVQQCWDYLNAVPDAKWGIVSNIVSFRLYHKDRGSRVFEHFTLQELRDNVRRFRQFYYLFAIGGLLPILKGQRPRAEGLLLDSRDQQREIGRKLYEKYHDQRVSLIRHLRQPPFDKTLDQAIHISQKLLDRIVFVAFCEQRGLLPPKVIQAASDRLEAFSLVPNPQWQGFLRLFRSIDKGNPNSEIPEYNGGLFEEDPEVDHLELDDDRTRFFRELSTYDFKNEVSVDVLGHIFEQSVTDLEQLRSQPERLEATPQRKPVGKRKREGIYYTPQFVTEYLVKETLGTCLDDRFDGLARAHHVDPKRGAGGNAARQWFNYQRAKLDCLQRFRVCDPACGSGAFLIQAFDQLEAIYADVLDELCDTDGKKYEKLRDDIKPRILRDNLFGVDLSDQAVEITRLALWIRSAQRGRKLTDLSHNILHGNSLVDDRQVDQRAFDWQKRFPEVFAAGGFDCVIGNPPYVKLQNFRQREPKIAAYLIERFRSARTGNFDLYLPFIERGLEILHPEGRMGFIAPNLWLFNEYGKGLRESIRERTALEKLVDFKSFQVFADATTYTALQIFSPKPKAVVQTADASDGDLQELRFFPVPYARLDNGAWALVDEARQAILDQMRERSVTLAEATGQIFQGLITSADAVYHLQKLGPGHYFSFALNQEVELEDELLKPLVSGEEAVPFATPPTDTYLLFPYIVSDDECRLATVKEMKKYRRCWEYLRKNEKTLRARESGKFDDDEWYRFGRNQSIDKQHLPKILVPRLLKNLFAAADPKGSVCIDNVDVGGIIVHKPWDLHYIVGILNSKACNFVWRSTSKPFRGEYRSANKQFIAPLPIPQTKNQKPVADLARQLADLHAQVLDATRNVHRRFAVDLPPRTPLQESPLPVKLSGKLQGFDALPMGELFAEMEKLARRQLTPQQRAKWDGYLTGEIDKLVSIKRQIADATTDLNERVYQLYGLSAGDVKQIEETCGAVQ